VSAHADNGGGVAARLAGHARVLGDPAMPVLERLRAYAELKRLSGELERELVARARREGTSWQGIAEVLGVARQTAHRRFGRASGSAG